MFTSLLSRSQYIRLSIRSTNHLYFDKPSRATSSDTSLTDNKSQIQKTKKQPYQLTEIDPPGENPDQQKKCVFQQFLNLQCSTPVYTMEQAAEYARSDGFRIYWRYPNLTSNRNEFVYHHLRSWMNEESMVAHFPDVTDFAVIGAGLIGSATAYYLKKTCHMVGDVLVLDKEPYSPHNSTAICNGLLSCQSKSEDIVRITAFSKELIRNLRTDVLCTNEDFASIKYQPCTHLILWPQDDVEDVMTAVEMQIRNGCYTDAKLPHELEVAFPFLKATDTDIAIGTHGNQDEALVDPIALRNLYRVLAQGYGANFIKAEVIDFNTVHQKDMPQTAEDSAGGVVVRIPATGELRNLGFAEAVLSLGHNTPYLEARSEMDDYMRDQIEDLHFIKPTLRIHYYFHSMAAPVINFPVITDTDGSTLIRDSFAGIFKYYLSYEESEQLAELSGVQFTDTKLDDPHVNLIHRHEVFEKYFYEVIKPRLVNRIPVMQDAEFDLAYSGFESYNPHDGCPVLGPHPYHCKLQFSGGGYGPRLMSYAPLVAASLMELCFGNEEETLDLTTHYWNRVIKGRRIDEFRNLVK